MNYRLLNKINSPADLKAIDEKEINELCREIRAFLIEKVEASGGHLASNLGITELTVAMHRVFDSPRDHFIFDVGHQSYVHKILTGRKDEFENLRRPGGLSGFTSMRESEHDAFGAGHSSTSVSAALGYSESDRLQSKDCFSVAVLGDGAYTGGMVHEALNNVNPDSKLIIILNENGMSISVNKGSFASYLSGVRISKGYVRSKRGLNAFLDKIPFLGKGVKWTLTAIKSGFKSMFLSQNYFEDLGLHYIGNVDGNDYEKVEKALKMAKSFNKCVVVHVKTQKGKGYAPAESAPDNYHSIANNPVENQSFHSLFSKKLISLAKDDEKIIGVTAAMGLGTGLENFGKTFPERYFDVGIAEEHALTFSAGLAAAGQKPYVAIYSTFLQRGYDNILHDIALQNLPVRIMIDRASLALADGATHHGIFDVAFLSHVPGMTVLSPITFGSLLASLDFANKIDTPIAIRYPNSTENPDVANTFYPSGDYDCFGVRFSFNKTQRPKYLFITYGNIINQVLLAEKIMKKEGHDIGIILIEALKPYEFAVKEILPYVKDAKSVLFVEEGIKNGGAGMILKSALSELGVFVNNFKIQAIDDSFAMPSEPCDLYEYLDMTPEKLCEKIKKI
jgi:1-deoxy-D-xylulose-5-phosphate synthase